MRDRDVRALNERIEGKWGMRPLPEDGPVETGNYENRVVYIASSKVLVIGEGEELLPSIHALLMHRPEGRYITVDMGAVPYVYNGADVMSPGVVSADPSIKEGEGAWVRDERNLAPLAVGIALVPGGMMRGSKGKALRTVHHVGDRFWGLEC
ncbi:MAG: PUA domain-containing protein [Candidatus Thermoplasmatota archaeon]